MRAGEGRFVHVHMGRERGTGGFAEARNHIEDGRRDASLEAQFRQPERGERRLLRRLEHQGAAGGESAADLAACETQRSVPGMIAPTTPTGSFSVKLTKLPGSEFSMVSPWIEVACPA